MMQLTHAGNAIASKELLAAVGQLQPKAGVKAPRTIESSEIVQKEMQPALSDLKDLAYVLMFWRFDAGRSDVTITVEKQKFRLHRAILIARCKWLSVLLAERWQRGDAHKAVEVTSMSADVFATVVEFIYTGCGLDHDYRGKN